MVELTSVRYEAGGTLIINDVSVRFRPSRFNVILGPNGAGKSTLLQIATGLRRPASGEVRYDGRPVSAFAPDALARVRAVLSQRIDLAFALPVEDVVLMGRYPHYGRVPTSHDRAIVDHALEVVGLTDKRRQAYPTLSGGEQQKVHLARVLAQIWCYNEPHAPSYLFLDEPTSSLDIHYQIHLLDIARDLLAHDCTVIAVLHDLNVAFQYGDAFLLLDQGRVACDVDRVEDISTELIERVFRVRAARVDDPETGQRFLRFAL